MKEYTVKVYDNRTEWWFNGKIHREDGPAIEWLNGDRSWWLNGQRHREDGPAFEYSNGDKHWYLNGQFHREDGPAREYVNGDKYWYLNGKRHREDGPAVEFTNGDRSWWLNGQYHREDGPAIEYVNGDKRWYLNGQQLTEEEFKAKTQPVELSEIGKLLEALKNDDDKLLISDIGYGLTVGDMKEIIINAMIKQYEILENDDEDENYKLVDWQINDVKRDYFKEWLQNYDPELNTIKIRK